MANCVYGYNKVLKCTASHPNKFKITRCALIRMQPTSRFSLTSCAALSFISSAEMEEAPYNHPYTLLATHDSYLEARGDTILVLLAYSSLQTYEWLDPPDKPDGFEVSTYLNLRQIKCKTRTHRGGNNAGNRIQFRLLKVIKRPWLDNYVMVKNTISTTSQNNTATEPHPHFCLC